MGEEEKIIMLGTGYGTATQRYNACFLLKTEGFTLLTDGGGGNEILRRLSVSGVRIGDIDAIFVSHTHIDHLFGVVWILRMIGEENIVGSRRMRVYGNRKVIDTLAYIGATTLSPRIWQNVCRNVELRVVADGEQIAEEGGVQLVCFDTHDAGEQQYGYKVLLPSGKTVVCLGDSPCKESLRAYVENADWLICEAFCLEADAELFHPHEYHHSTVKQTAHVAEAMAVKNLIVFHTEDKTTDRKRRYTAEAESEYHGSVYVPEDMETITL